MIWFLDVLVTWLPRSVFGTQTTPLQTLLVCNLIQMSPRLAEATNLVKRELSLYDLQEAHLSYITNWGILSFRRVQFHNSTYYPLQKSLPCRKKTFFDDSPMSTMNVGSEDVDTPLWSWDTGTCWPEWPRESLSLKKKNLKETFLGGSSVLTHSFWSSDIVQCKSFTNQFLFYI